MDAYTQKVAHTLKIVRLQYSQIQSLDANMLSVAIPAWKSRTIRMLEGFLVPEELQLLQSINTGTWLSEKITLVKSMKDLEEGIIAIPEQYVLPDDPIAAGLDSTSSEPPKSDAPILYSQPSTNIFVVHGHDSLAKTELARALEKLKLNPIILHEQANEGKTIIEKFERDASRVCFAVILMTPDDEGHPFGKPDDIQPRARQNVILELGYFSGALGRAKVCVLHKGGVEIPSDYLGVIYIFMDDSGAWIFSLAKELKQAGLPIDLNGLI